MLFHRNSKRADIECRNVCRGEEQEETGFSSHVTRPHQELKHHSGDKHDSTPEQPRKPSAPPRPLLFQSLGVHSQLRMRSPHVHPLVVSAICYPMTRPFVSSSPNSPGERGKWIQREQNSLWEVGEGAFMTRDRFQKRPDHRQASLGPESVRGPV